MIENRVLVSWVVRVVGREHEETKEPEETFRNDKDVDYLDCGYGFKGINICQNICRLYDATYTSIIRIKKFKIYMCHFYIWCLHLI